MQNEGNNKCRNNSSHRQQVTVQSKCQTQHLHDAHQTQSTHRCCAGVQVMLCLQAVELVRWYTRWDNISVASTRTILVHGHKKLRIYMLPAMHLSFAK